MKKRKKITSQQAIIIGSIIISITMIFIYSNTPSAILSKKCKMMVKELGYKNTDIVEAQIYSLCLNGKIK